MISNETRSEAYIEPLVAHFIDFVEEGTATFISQTHHQHADQDLSVSYWSCTNTPSYSLLT